MAVNVVGMAFNPVYYNHLMDIVQTDPELRETAKGMFKQTAWTAAGTIAGGLVAGPVGAVFGGCVSSYLGYKLSDDYASMVEVLKNLPDAEKHELVMEVQELVGSSSVEALTSFVGGQGQAQALLALLKSVTSGKSRGGYFSPANWYVREGKRRDSQLSLDSSVDPPRINKLPQSKTDGANGPRKTSGNSNRPKPETGPRRSK